MSRDRVMVGKTDFFRANFLNGYPFGEDVVKLMFEKKQAVGFEFGRGVFKPVFFHQAAQFVAGQKRTVVKIAKHERGRRAVNFPHDFGKLNDTMAVGADAGEMSIGDQKLLPVFRLQKSQKGAPVGLASEELKDAVFQPAFPQRQADNPGEAEFIFGKNRQLAKMFFPALKAGRKPRQGGILTTLV